MRRQADTVQGTNFTYGKYWEEVRSQTCDVPHEKDPVSTLNSTEPYTGWGNIMVFCKRNPNHGMNYTICYGLGIFLRAV